MGNVTVDDLCSGLLKSTRTPRLADTLFYISIIEPTATQLLRDVEAVCEAWPPEYPERQTAERLVGSTRARLETGAPKSGEEAAARYCEGLARAVQSLRRSFVVLTREGAQ